MSDIGLCTIDGREESRVRTTSTQVFLTMSHSISLPSSSSNSHLPVTLLNAMRGSDANEAV